MAKQRTTARAATNAVKNARKAQLSSKATKKLPARSAKTNKRSATVTKQKKQKLSAAVTKQPAKTKKIMKKPAKVAKKVVNKTTQLVKPTSPKKATKQVSQPKTEKKVQIKTPAVPKGYTSDEYTKYKQEKKRLSQLGNAELKAMLKKNLQSMSGNKDQLVQKIADGIVLGRIPRCPNCFGGRPRYDYKKGTYNCPGYRDDVDYKNCHSTFTKQDLKRDPWEA